MFGIGKAKADKQLTPSQAFERFKAEVIAAVGQAKKAGVWDQNLGTFLESYGHALGGGR
jgi:hypothetical protein